MVRWYIKEFSNLTKVSIRTLRHYDALDLLSPSVRLQNGYRLYTEKDLLKLQKIIALKFFGFELLQIKAVLMENLDINHHFSLQAKFLQEKANTLWEASKILENIIFEKQKNKSIPWETVIKSIEVFRMTQQLEKTWAGKIFNSEELKEYAKFEESLKERISEKDEFSKNWLDLVNQIESNLNNDPTSEIGITLGKRCMELVNHLYGKRFAGLRRTIWEKGFKTGQIDSEYSPEIICWLDQAISAYYKARIYQVLQKVDCYPHTSVSQQWQELMEEMYGDSQPLKDEVIEAALVNDKISELAKKWLKELKQS